MPDPSTARADPLLGRAGSPTTCPAPTPPRQEEDSLDFGLEEQRRWERGIHRIRRTRPGRVAAPSPFAGGPGRRRRSQFHYLSPGRRRRGRCGLRVNRGSLCLCTSRLLRDQPICRRGIRDRKAATLRRDGHRASRGFPRLWGSQHGERRRGRPNLGHDPNTHRRRRSVPSTRKDRQDREGRCMKQTRGHEPLRPSHRQQPVPCPSHRHPNSVQCCSPRPSVRPNPPSAPLSQRGDGGIS